ncbi:MAG: PIN domain-containing protein [Nanoarchaeota archaeon]
MAVKRYFFDSYALIEIGKNNPAYLKYADSLVTITIFNLVEIMYSVFQDLGEEKAREVHEKFQDCVQDFDESIIMEALKTKKIYKKRDLSYADCLGYAFAKKKGLLFLTGDEGFKDLANVEFVK